MFYPRPRPPPPNVLMAMSRSVENIDAYFFIKVLFYKLWIYLTCLSHADVEFNVFTPGPIVTLKCLYKANFASRQNAEVKFTGDERLANESMQMPWRYGRNFPVKTSKMVSDVPSDNSILLRIPQ